MELQRSWLHIPRGSLTSFAFSTHMSGARRVRAAQEMSFPVQGHQLSLTVFLKRQISDRRRWRIRSFRREELPKFRTTCRGRPERTYSNWAAALACITILNVRLSSPGIHFHRSRLISLRETARTPEVTPASSKRLATPKLITRQRSGTFSC